MQDRLHAYLSRQWADADDVEIVDFAPILGGYSRETYRFDARVRRGATVEIHELILRKDPAQPRIVTSRQAEHDLLNLLAAKTSLPVPRSFFVETDPSHFGDPGMIIQRGSGSGAVVSLFSGESRDEAGRVATALCETLAALHTIDPASLGLDSRFEDPRGIGCTSTDWDAYMDANINWYIETYRQLKFAPLPVYFDMLLSLRREKPRPLPFRLCHGDFNPGNFLFHDGRVTLLYDWESAHIGDPREELGYFLYMDRLMATDFWSSVPSEGGFLGHYNRLTGFHVTQDEVNYFLMFAATPVGLPALELLRQAVRGESQDLFNVYVIQPTATTLAMYTQLLGYPAAPA